MKRIVPIILLLFLLLTSCADRKATLSFENANERLSAVYVGRNGFVRADDDFVLTNFGAPDYLSDSAVYLSENGEIGIFSLTETVYVSEMVAQIESYLEIERRSVVELAALYPADELAARLARFDNAHISSVGSLVYYTLLDHANTKTAQDLLQQ